MIKSDGKETPVSLYKFYLHDNLTPILQELREKLNIKTNAELFTRMILHIFQEVRMIDQMNQDPKIDVPESQSPESKL